MSRFLKSLACVMLNLTIVACGASHEDAPPAGQSALTRAAASHEQLARLFDRYWDERIAYEDAVSPQILADALEVEKHFLAELNSIPRDALSADERLSYDIFKQQREMAVEGFTYPGELMPMNPFGGMPLKFAVIAAQSAESSLSVAQYDRWLRAADDYVAWTRQAIANMRDGALRGYTSPRVLIERMLPILESLGADTASNVFYTPLSSMSENMAAADRARLTAGVREAVSRKVLPATRALYDYLKHEYLPKARAALSLADLPLGSQWYEYRVRRAVGPGAVPADVHRLGLSEVERLKPQLQALASVPASNPAIPAAQSPAVGDALAAYEELGKQVAANLPLLFADAQAAPYEIRATGFVPMPATPLYYRAAASGSNQPAVLFVNALELELKPDIAAFLQQAVPGHHLQSAIQRARDDLPRFRRFGADPAFVAGWGLYAVTLGEELGMYGSDADKFRALKLQMRCAAALVVDTGLHSQGWTRAKALEYLRTQASIEDIEAATLIDEYVAMPGDALSCAMGATKIRGLRTKMQESLGARYDIREFHAQVLKDGAMPLNLLEAKVNTWIEGMR
jgi:uncharacterized protein (DUF885 family)